MSRSGTPAFSATVMRRASRTMAPKRVRLGAPVLLGRRGRPRVGGRGPPPARAAPRRRGQPVLLGHRALAHRRAVEDGPPVVVGLAADVLVDAESVRGELAAADGAGQQAARRRGGGERRRFRGRLPALRARRGPRRLRLELRPEGGGGGLARRVGRGAGPGRALARGRAREMGSDSARAAFAVSPFQDRRCSAAFRGALHFSRCSSSSPCKIGLSQRGHGTSTDAHLRWHWGRWILRLWGK